jgi:hypothetical protein
MFAQQNNKLSSKANTGFGGVIGNLVKGAIGIGLSGSGIKNNTVFDTRPLNPNSDDTVSTTSTVNVGGNDKPVVQVWGKPKPPQYDVPPNPNAKAPEFQRVRYDPSTGTLNSDPVYDLRKKEAQAQNGMGSVVNNAAKSMFAQQNKRSSNDTIISLKSIIEVIGKVVGGPVGDIIGKLGGVLGGDLFGSNNQNQSTNSTERDTIGALGGVLGGALGGNVFGSNNQNQSTNSTAPESNSAFVSGAEFDSGPASQTDSPSAAAAPLPDAAGNPPPTGLGGIDGDTLALNESSTQPSAPQEIASSAFEASPEVPSYADNGPVASSDLSGSNNSGEDVDFLGGDFGSLGGDFGSFEYVSSINKLTDAMDSMSADRAAVVLARTANDSMFENPALAATAYT